MPENPSPICETLEDGSILVRFGHLAGIVSSSHLVEPKINQLRSAWIRENQEQFESFHG